MSADDIDLDERTARALELSSLDRKTVAERLAQIGGLRTPTRRETEEFLVEVLVNALSQIPSANAAWSWGEFHNAGLQPLYDLSDKKDWSQWAAYAADLTQPDGRSRNLIGATEHLLSEVAKRLEAAGVSPYGQPTTPPSS